MPSTARITTRPAAYGQDLHATRLASARGSEDAATSPGWTSERSFMAGGYAVRPPQAACSSRSQVLATAIAAARLTSDRPSVGVSVSTWNERPATWLAQKLK